MKLRKNLVRVLALILIVSMLLPSAAFAALKDEANGQKAKTELVYMEIPDGGDFPVETDTKTDDWNIGDVFYVGVKVSDLGNIVESDNGMYMFSTSLVYDNAYLEVEPDYMQELKQLQAEMEAEGDEYDAETEFGPGLIVAWNRRMEGQSIFTKVGANVRYTFKSSNAVADVTEDVSTVSKTRVHFQLEYYSPTGAPSYKGAAPALMNVIQFKVKQAPPADGKKVFDIALGTIDGSTPTQVTFGAGGKTKAYSANATVAEDLRLLTVMDYSTAQVNLFPATYTIVYDANAGDDLTDVDVNETGATTTVRAGETITQLPTGTATHTDGSSYAVVGWYTDAACSDDNKVVQGETKITDEMADEAAGTVTLYAKWDQKIVITLDPNGGTLAEGTENPIMLSSDATSLEKAIDDPTREHYNFLGWYAATDGYYTVAADDSNKRGNGYDTISTTGSETWFAAWEVDSSDPEAEEVTVTFDANGGSDVTPATVTVNKNDSINASGADGKNMPAPPTREPYAFNGWNTKINGSGDTFDGTTEVTEDITVYAQWTAPADADDEDKHTVTFHSNDDVTVKPATYEVPAAAAPVTVDASLIPGYTVHKEGYEVTGWYVAESDGGDGWTATETKYEAGYEITGDIDVIPVLEKAVTVNLHYNGKSHVAGDDDPDLLTITTYAGKKLSEIITGDNKTTIEDSHSAAYTLLGWSTEPQWGNANTWDDLSSADKYTADSVVDADTDLYAWWETYVTVESITDALTYDGQEHEWSDDVAKKAVTFTGADSSKSAARGTPLTLIYDESDHRDYEVEIYTTNHFPDPENEDENNIHRDEDGQKETATTSYKRAGDYCVHFTSRNPEIVFDTEYVNLSVEKAKVKLEITPSVDPSDEDPDVPVQPGIKVTVIEKDDEGEDQPRELDPEKPEDKALIDSILKELNFEYYRLEKGTDVTGEVIQAENVAKESPDYLATLNNPYLEGDYVVAMKPSADCGYELPTDEDGHVVPGAFGLTDTSKALDYENAPKLDDGWKTDYGFTDPPYAFLLHVDANNRTVTFKTSTDADALNTLSEHGSVTVKSNTSISDTESNPDAEMPADPTKLDNLQFQGWFIVDNATDDHDDALAKYEAWKAITGEGAEADASRAALKFTAESTVSKDLIVVAVWTPSTISGLKPPTPPDPEDPDAPEDHVGGLKLATSVKPVEGVACSKADDETHTEHDASCGFVEAVPLNYVDITQYYDDTYKVAKDFNAEGTDNNYYIRVANDQALLKITLETGEPGATVAVTQYYGATTGDGATVTMTTSATDNTVRTAADIELTVADEAKANIFVIEVTAPDKETTSTYTVHVQRLAKAEIKLNYGNSPYGLIMADAKITDKAAAKAAFVSNGNCFTVGNLPAGGYTNVIYQLQAWGLQEEGVTIDYDDPEINLDRNDHAIFVYNREDFVDPGFTAKDSLGRTLAFTSVTREFKADIMSDSGMNGLDDKTVSNETIAPAATKDGRDAYDMSVEAFDNGVRPGIYRISYKFTDPTLPETDNEIVVERYVVVLNTYGDADNDTGRGGADATAVLNLVAGRLNFVDYKFEALFRYRVMDADNDNGIGGSDATTILNVVAGRSDALRFYCELPGDAEDSNE